METSVCFSGGIIHKSSDSGLNHFILLEANALWNAGPLLDNQRANLFYDADSLHKNTNR